MNRMIIALSLGLMATCAFAQGTRPTSGDHAGLTLPESKRTTLGLYVTASEAYAKWEADPQNVTLIDVRTPEEYVFVGHPEMAWSIPVHFNVVESDGEYGKLTMKQNAAFVTEVKQIAQQQDTIMVICRSGSRSAAAANLLVEAGFQRVFNIVDGVEGDKVDDLESVFHGKRMKNGWKNSGLPWTYDVVPGRMRLSPESAN